MFVVHLLVGYYTLALLGTDFGFLTSNVVLAGKGIKYTVIQDRKTWQDAGDDCFARGDALGFFLSYEEYNALGKYINDQNLLPKDETSGYWLGGKFNYETNNFRWDLTNINTTDEKYFMAGWHWNQPDRKAKNGETKDCMELLYTQGNVYNTSLAWSSLWCDEKRGYICQRPQ